MLLQGQRVNPRDEIGGFLPKLLVSVWFGSSVVAVIMIKFNFSENCNHELDFEVKGLCVTEKHGNTVLTFFMLTLALYRNIWPQQYPADISY